MRPLLQSVSRAVVHGFTIAQSVAGRRTNLQSLVPPFVCVQCRHRSSFLIAKRILEPRKHFIHNTLEESYRRWSSVTRLRRDERGSTESAEGGKKDSLADDITIKETPMAPPAKDYSVHVVPDEELPSYRERMRWRLSKKFNLLMDDLMPKLALASQRINNYTGTDYSGIEALRKEIIEQENLVKTRHAAVQQAKEALESARAQESSSRKEVVGLLERKHAWSDSDLERYMSIIRSEHANDQAVQAAKDSVSAAEKALEEARTRLEKRERMQYHEEQIWSDTIRRNSTWVTFGLMGVNIILLLTSLVIFEPWRRRRMVKEIRAALEEHKPIASVIPAIEKEIDEVVEPVGVTLESIPAPPAPASKDITAIAEILSQPDMSPTKDVHTVSGTETEKLLEEESTPVWIRQWSLNGLKQNFQQLFSEQQVYVRRVDITTVALQGAAAGATVASCLVFLIVRLR